MSILWWLECLLHMATWAPQFCGDLKTLILLRPGDLHPMEFWRSPSYDDLKISPIGDIRPSHCGNLKISTLWRPLPIGDLNTVTLWLQKPPPSHNNLQTCGDLETSILRRPGDLHWPRSGDLHPAATWRPPSCGDLETSTRPRSGDIHSAMTWRPTSLWQPRYRLPPPCSDPISVLSDDVAGNYHPEATSSFAPCGDLVLCPQRRPRPLPPAATSILPPQATIIPPESGTWIPPFWDDLVSSPAPVPSLQLPGYLPNAATLGLPSCGVLEISTSVRSLPLKST